MAAEQMVLTVTAETGNDGILRAAVVGEADLSTADGLHRQLVGLLDTPGCRVLDLDLSRLRFCDCATLSVLLRARRTAVDRHRRIVISAADSNPHLILMLTGVYILFDYPRPISDTR